MVASGADITGAKSKGSITLRMACDQDAAADQIFLQLELRMIQYFAAAWRYGHEIFGVPSYAPVRSPTRFE
jgi:hypothetical protein